MNSGQTTYTPQQLSWFDRNRGKAIGDLYLIGDAALAVNGILAYQAEKRLGNHKDAKIQLNDIKAGGLWALGGLAMARYEDRPFEKQMEALEHRLAAHFQEQGITLTEEVLLKAKKENDKGFFQKFEDFCYKYPKEILNAVYGIGACFLIKGGHDDLKDILAAEQNRSFKARDIYDVSSLGMGLSILAGALSGLLIKNKSKEQIEEEGIGSFRGAIHEHASWFNGGFYLLNNVFTIKGAMANKEKYQSDKYKNLDGSVNFFNQNMYLLRTITAASYITSNILIGTGASAEKAAAERAEDAKVEILRGCAQIINAQDPKLRDALI
jgi:hypothetical protein